MGADGATTGHFLSRSGSCAGADENGFGTPGTENENVKLNIYFVNSREADRIEQSVTSSQKTTSASPTRSPFQLGFLRKSRPRGFLRGNWLPRSRRPIVPPSSLPVNSVLHLRRCLSRATRLYRPNIDAAIIFLFIHQISLPDVNRGTRRIFHAIATLVSLGAPPCLCGPPQCARCSRLGMNLA